MKKLFVFIFLLIFLLPAYLPLLHKGFFLSDDGEWMIIRFSAFYEAFKDGQIPVRFLPRLNYMYGYPVADFLYPGFMYLGLFIKALRVGFVDTIKIILFGSLVGSAFGMYLWLSKIFKQIPAIVAAVIYVYLPYHLFDVYTRGSVGEMLALAIVPFIFWQIERKSFWCVAVLIASLILSHNTLAILFLPIVFTYMLFFRRTHFSSSQIFGILLLALGLSLFFWFPALFDLQYTIFSKTSVSDISKYFADVYLIGLSTFAIGCVYLFFSKRRIGTPIHTRAVLFFVCLLISIFLSASVSEMFWQMLPISFIQFPFRVLSVEIISVSFLTAYILDYLHKKKLQLFTGGAICLVVISGSFTYISPSIFFDKGEGFYSTNLDTTTVKKEYMPKWVQTQFFQPPVKKIEAERAGISSIASSAKNIQFTITSNHEQSVRVNTLYYPGWRAYIDDNRVPINYENPKGIIQLSLKPGTHKVKLLFSETSVRFICDIVSLISILVLLGLIRKGNT